ncbi:MAG: FAD-dependent oxidoreductase [Actinobacteria bacterium]|nr:FAD-dependent oxidoreductase [Actinomycetota bacterium]
MNAAGGEFIQEPVRQTPVRGRADVIVAGGGPAGLMGAVAAARNGARVVLVERYGYLGGQMNIEHSSFIGTPTLGMGFQGVNGRLIIGGVPWEFMQRIKAMGGSVGPIERTVLSSLEGGYLNAPYGRFGPKVDPAVVKTAALEMVQEAGIELLLHCWAVDAVAEDGEVRGVIVQSKSGREAILANAVVDATADADMAASAGATWVKVPREQLYRMNVELILGGVDTERARAFMLEHPEQFNYVIFPTHPEEVPPGFQKPIWAVVQLGEKAELRLQEDRLALKARGPRAEIMIGIRPGVSNVSVGFDGDPTDVQDLTTAEVVGRSKALENTEWLRQRIPGFEGCFVISESPLGTRESRRIVGDYTLTEEDLWQGRRFEDAIGQSSIPIDRHLPGGGWSFELLPGSHDIPYRCLLPQGVENLLVAGRALSADHLAQSSLRKVTACMTMGQAAGTAAAIATREGVGLRQLDVTALQTVLREQGALFGGEEGPEYR